LADIYASMSGAVGSLSGPLHGGANEEVLVQLKEIPNAEAAPAWFDHMIDTKQKVMGLGHRVYKVKDPRAGILQRMAADLFSTEGSTPLYDIAHAIEKRAAEKVGPKGVWPDRGSLHADLRDRPHRRVERALARADGGQSHLPTGLHLLGSERPERAGHRSALSAGAGAAWTGLSSSRACRATSPAGSRSRTHT
jgi:hypothetical protein